MGVRMVLNLELRRFSEENCCKDVHAWDLVRRDGDLVEHSW
jgi:hypothetical protein